MRLIDADVMVRDLKKLSAKQSKRYGQNDISVTMTNAIIADIESIPTVEPQRIKGRWVRKESDLSWWYECSECGDSPLFDPYEHEVRSPFCPFCGSDMRGDEDVGKSCTV